LPHVGVVDLEKTPLHVHHPKAQGRGIDGRLIGLDSLDEAGLQALTLGDVADDGEEHRFAVHFEEARVQFHRHHRAVLAVMRGLESRLAAAQYLGEALGHPNGELGRVQLRDRPPQNLVSRIAQALVKSRIAIDDDPLPIHHQHAIGHDGEQHLVQLVGRIETQRGDGNSQRGAPFGVRIKRQ